MIRIHTDEFVPKYQNGKWLWNEDDEKIEFEPQKSATMVQEEFIKTGGYKFATKVNQLEEMIFRQEFQRPENTHDADVILAQDIKNLVLFLSPSEIVTPRFVTFVNTFTVDRFIHSLIIYFEYYLKMVEFVLIRRDEISSEKALIQSEDSTEIKRIFSAQLSRYRLLLARDYSPIILGEGEVKPFYHITPIVNISQTIGDKSFHESFLAFCTQIVWIAMHRRAYDVIDMEMGRLFRSEHFKLVQSSKICFSRAEASMLYGKNYRRVNYRAQNSPLIQELANVSMENLPILWIGARKYRGNDLAIHQLELEYIVPDSQLSLIDVIHGILGHPKKIYDTLLNIDWEAVRFQNYSKAYDPYHIVRQPCLEIPKINAEKLRKHAETYVSYYQIVNHHEGMSKGMVKKWKRRDKVIKYFKTEGLLVSVWTKCEKELKRQSYGPSVAAITAKFIEDKKKLRKQVGTKDKKSE